MPTLNDYDFILVAVPRGSTSLDDAIDYMPFRNAEGSDLPELRDMGGEMLFRFMKQLDSRAYRMRRNAMPLETD